MRDRDRQPFIRIAAQLRRSERAVARRHEELTVELAWKRERAA